MQDSLRSVWMLVVLLLVMSPFVDLLGARDYYFDVVNGCNVGDPIDSLTISVLEPMQNVDAVQAPAGWRAHRSGATASFGTDIANGIAGGYTVFDFRVTVQDHVNRFSWSVARHGLPGNDYAFNNPVPGTSIDNWLVSRCENSSYSLTNCGGDNIDGLEIKLITPPKGLISELHPYGWGQDLHTSDVTWTTDGVGLAAGEETPYPYFCIAVEDGHTRSDKPLKGKSSSPMFQWRVRRNLAWYGWHTFSPDAAVVLRENTFVLEDCQTLDPIPTLSEWALIVFGIVLAVPTTYYIIRRRQLTHARA